MRTILFVPGGPGQSSEPDRRALQPHLERAGIRSVFWNEPSPLRPDGTPFRAEGAYAALLEDLAGTLRGLPAPVALVGTSFGAYSVSRLLADDELRGRVGDVVLIGPVFDQAGCLRRIMELSRADFAATAPDKARRLARLLGSTRELFDEPMQQGLALAFENPGLPQHYFADDEALAAWAAVLAEPAWGTDPVSQAAVLADLRDAPPLPDGAFDLPCRVVFGDRDPVSSPGLVRERLDADYPGWSCRVVREAGHWPHLEKPAELARVVASPE
jgi:pimeloyl-ACP methyl ester carboxylesterase